MLFNSVEFLRFFPLVVLAYFLTPHRWRWVLLLAASYYFYACWRVEYLSLILFSTVVDYAVSMKLGSEKDPRLRKLLLWTSLSVNLGLLAFFKYYGFFSANVNELLVAMGMDYMAPAMGFLLPMGISFYTFQTMAYTIDVYFERIKPERHLGYFALYVTYFPQLVAGPIERAQNLLHQLRARHEFSESRFISGGKQMLWGFFKKMVIADRVAPLVDMAYADPASMDGAMLLLGTYLFAVQIYCDFSGYSDIAIGASRLLGIELMENFRTPYLSKSIREFWGRWHISLSSWFRDYLYKPLGGNRVSKVNWYRNLMIVFVVSGFWHGANWTFMAWGFLHGLYLIVALLAAPLLSYLEGKGVGWKSRLISGVKVFVTFHLVVLAWVYFRAETVTDAHLILGKVLSGDMQLSALRASFDDYGFKDVLGILMLVAMFVLIDPIMDRLVKDRKAVPVWVDFIIYPMLVALILLAGSFGKVDFIYFQF